MYISMSARKCCPNLGDWRCTSRRNRGHRSRRCRCRRCSCRCSCSSGYCHRRKFRQEPLALVERPDRGRILLNNMVWGLVRMWNLCIDRCTRTCVCSHCSDRELHTELVHKGCPNAHTFLRSTRRRTRTCPRRTSHAPHNCPRPYKYIQHRG
jgi:hypothetical protein